MIKKRIIQQVLSPTYATMYHQYISYLVYLYYCYLCYAIILTNKHNVTLLVVTCCSYLFINSTNARRIHFCTPCMSLEECDQKPNELCEWGEFKDRCGRWDCAKVRLCYLYTLSTAANNNLFFIVGTRWKVWWTYEHLWKLCWRSHVQIGWTLSWLCRIKRFQLSLLQPLINLILLFFYKAAPVLFFGNLYNFYVTICDWNKSVKRLKYRIISYYNYTNTY